MTHGTWLLLRGLTRESGHWGDFLPRLAAQLAPAAVLAVDLPGAGARWRERSPTTLTAITDDVRAQVRSLEGPLRVLGLSMGGMVALDWAARWPHELAGVLVVNSSAGGLSAPTQRLRPGAWPALLRVLASNDAPAVEACVLRLTSARPDAHAHVLHDWIALRRRHPVTRANALRQAWAAARFVRPPAAPAVPLRVLCGARDALVDPACSRALAVAWSLPLAIHPDAGHDLPLDAPDWLAEQAAALQRGTGG